MVSGFSELAIVILLAAILGILAKILKQPLILAFIVTGAVISYFGFFNLNNQESLKTFSDLGIMFLLFLIGLEINYSSLKSVGKISLIVGLGQIIFTSAIGFFIARAFDFNFIQSAYIAIALTFSSTIIIVKLLSEKKDLNSLYGKISVGFLLVQDFVAILLLIFLAGVGKEGNLVIGEMALTVVKGVVLFSIMVWLGRKIIPLIFDKIARSQELLFVSSLAWAFLLVTIAEKLGFSIEIGGFLAGLALANSSEHFQIASRIKSLRDFFILVFFVILGSSFIFSSLHSLILPIIVLSLFVLIGNPIIVMIIMGLMGYRKRTSFMCGITVAQISEFSLILAAMGLKLGHLNDNTVALITMVGIITITLSTYLITYADGFFSRLHRILNIFEKKKTKENDLSEKSFNKPIILIGSHRLGQSIAFNLHKENLLVIDFDPEVISSIKKHGYDYLFGDVSDEEIFEKANFENAKIVISTVPDFKDNLALLQKLNNLRKRGFKIKVVIRAENENEVEMFYKFGADYVIFPHFTSGQYLGRTIAIDPQMKILEELRLWDLNTLRKLERKNSA